MKSALITLSLVLVAGYSAIAKNVQISQKVNNPQNREVHQQLIADGGNNSDRPSRGDSRRNG